MAIKFEDNIIIGCGTMIRAPSDTEIDAKRNIVRNVGKVLDLYEPAAREKLDIPAEATAEDIESVVNELRENPTATPDESAAVVAKSKIGQLIGDPEKLIKFSASIIAIAKSGVELIKSIGSA
ncbi:hypothetical protein [Pseudomonas syringae]|uniref:hypothetical protein n=1 Tax=Pseudomonas syringae TaxID=317 RepID=UPI000465ADFD|nr:hypothetical protein [Pseudomonas syringae]